ncbi:MAG: FAD-binding oxidoreductase [Candidatus Heimdallarchaeota archaeon]
MTKEVPSWKLTAEAPSETSFDSITRTKGIDNIRETQAAYLNDESRYGEGTAEVIFFPRNEAEVAAVLREAENQGTAVTIAGARTGLAGGAAPRGGVVLSLEHMNALLNLRYNEESQKWHLVAQPGISLDEIREAIEYKKLEDLRPKCPEAVDQFLKEGIDYFYPPDPTEMTAWLGGTVATNASGAASFKYGATRPWIHRLRMVLAGGDMLEVQRGTHFASSEGVFQIKRSNGTEIPIILPTYTMPACKNAAGLYSKPEMDFIDLIIGSEGILGVITEIEIILEPHSEFMALVIFLPSEEEAVGFVEDIRSSNVAPEFIEYFDPNAVELLRKKHQENPGSLPVPSFPPEANAFIFLEVAYTEDSLEEIMMTLEEKANAHGTSMENTWAAMEANEIQKLKVLRHAIPETVNTIIAQRKRAFPAVHKLGTDMSVPDEHLQLILSYYRDELTSAGLDFVIFGHIGDNHVHVNILPQNEEELEQGKQLYLQFATKVVELGGSVSAEHGIGKLKRDFLQIMYGPQGLREIAAIKKALDPRGILNPDCMISVDLLSYERNS